MDSSTSSPQSRRVSGSPACSSDHPCPGPVGEGRVAVELRPRRLVERVGVGHQQLRLRRVLADVEQVLDEHAERRAPVADVVLPDHVVPEVLQHARQRVADDRGAQVADVHLLGHVGRGVVDRDRPAAPGSARRARVGGHAVTCAAIHASSASRLTNPGPLISDALGDPVEVELLDDPRGDVARRLPSRLASARAALAWKSANWLGRITGSSPRNSEPSARSIASDTRGASASMIDMRKPEDPSLRHLLATRTRCQTCARPRPVPRTKPP